MYISQKHYYLFESFVDRRFLAPPVKTFVRSPALEEYRQRRAQEANKGNIVTMTHHVCHHHLKTRESALFFHHFERHFRQSQAPLSHFSKNLRSLSKRSKMKLNKLKGHCFLSELSSYAVHGGYAQLERGSHFLSRRCASIITLYRISIFAWHCLRFDFEILALPTRITEVFSLLVYWLYSRLYSE